MTLTIILLCLIALLTLLLFAIGKDWDERGKELEREKKISDSLMEQLIDEKARADKLTTENWQLKRGQNV